MALGNIKFLLIVNTVLFFIVIINNVSFVVAAPAAASTTTKTTTSKTTTTTTAGPAVERSAVAVIVFPDEIDEFGRIKIVSNNDNNIVNNNFIDNNNNSNNNNKSPCAKITSPLLIKVSVEASKNSLSEKDLRMRPCPAGQIRADDLTCRPTAN